jgi:acid phosphatase family membrane protein YuiD
MVQFLLSKTNVPFVSAILAAVVAQVIKALIAAVTRNEAPRAALVKAGGMPSSHSALAWALFMSVLWHNGWQSSETGVAGIMAVIVIYDAAIIRRAMQEQTKTLRILLERAAPDLLEEFWVPKSLGHTGREVLAGMVMGIAVARAVYWLGCVRL